MLESHAVKIFGEPWTRLEKIYLAGVVGAFAGVGVMFFAGLPAWITVFHPTPRPALNSSEGTAGVNVPPSSRPQKKPPDGASSVPPRKQVALQEVTVFLYNDANDPIFSVDDSPTHPTRYASGIATFSLTAGTHVIRAEYSARTCSATVSVPFQQSEPVPANCNLKRSGGS
jgi:hypothetical protein